MKITTLHYERKRSDGSYGNRSLSLTVELEDGEDAALVIGQVMHQVRGSLDQDEREDDEQLRTRSMAEPPDVEDDEDDDDEDDEIPY